jgi:hypothetical protein
VGFVPVPAAPAVVGAYLASLSDKAPTTIRRRLAALAKMHRFNDLPWNAAGGGQRCGLIGNRVPWTERAGDGRHLSHAGCR